MAKIKMDKNKALCLASIIIIVFAQALEKILGVTITPSQTSGLICAMFYTLLVAVVYFLISKTTSSLMGILAALLAMKMMPPNIVYLADYTTDGTMLYFIVQKFSVLLFAVLVYKFYAEQEKPRAIKPLPILMLFLAIPFSNQISNFACSYFLVKTGSMLIPYLTQYACYAAAVIVILVVSYKCGKESFRFTAYFEFIALGINTFRQLGKLAYLIVSGQHVSKSIYGWIILFVAFIVVYAVMLKKSNQQALVEE